MVNFVVSVKAMRPASDKRECFYCQQPIGENHKVDCVLIRRTVKVHMAIEFEREEPFSFGKELIEFGMNESSWCQSNILDELKRYAEKRQNGCMCGMCTFVVLEMHDDIHLNEAG